VPVTFALGDMNTISVDHFAEMSAPMLRLTEAKYLFEQFKSARNAEPNYGLFLLTVYFDSFLLCFASIEDMVDQPTRRKLRSVPSFVFFKALRNIATHHSVLSGLKGKFPRPISRLVSVGIGAPVEFSEQFFLLPDKLRNIFDAILMERPNQKRTIEAAQAYLAGLEAPGTKIMIVDLIQTAITEVEPHVA
jgi:hypothetical protein